MDTKTLWLIRHAKAKQDGATDFDRKLSKRGLRQCMEMAPRFGSEEHMPEHYLVSKAMRAKDTAEALYAETGGSMYLSRALYTFNEDALMQTVRELILAKDLTSTRILAVVGHNFAVSGCVATLTGDDSMSALPTLGIAAVQFEGAWLDLPNVSATLVTRMVPVS